MNYYTPKIFQLFGQVVIVTIFISTASLLVESGFGEALIQKKNPNEIDYSSVFYLNIFVASVLYGILYFAAPFIALLFEEPTIILRVLSLVLFFGALNLIQNVILTRTMQFKKLFISSFVAVVISGLAVTAESVIKILLNVHWLPAVPFLQIFCAYYTFWPTDTSNNQVIKSLGRSEIFLKLEVIKTIFGLK